MNDLLRKSDYFQFYQEMLSTMDEKLKTEKVFNQTEKKRDWLNRIHAVLYNDISDKLSQIQISNGDCWAMIDKQEKSNCMKKNQESFEQVWDFLSLPKENLKKDPDF